MKTTLRNKWIRALKSGKYRQVPEKLGNRGKGRCCLGVLCDVMNYKFRHVYGANGDGDENKAVYQYIGKTIGSRQRDALSGKNDNGVSFEKIALWIKEHL